MEKKLFEVILFGKLKMSLVLVCANKKKRK